MKLFGDPKLECKVKQWRDKLAAAAVLAISGALAFCAGVWIAGTVFHVVFWVLGVT